jgi:exodeoxyribonuclease VII small subunit
VARKKTDSPLDFEKALAELEQLVERLEEGELPLEASLAEFERGIQLTRQCQQALRDAEQKVRLLTEQGEEVPFEPEDKDDD